MLQNAAPPRKSPLWSSNTSTSCVSCIAHAAQNASFQILLKCLTPVIVFETALKLLQEPNVLLTFDKVHNPLRLPRKTTSERPKVLRTLSFYTFDSEMCSAHLRATTACNFSSLIWPHGSAPAALASLLFDPPEPQIIGKQWKTQCFATFLPLRAPGSSFFWDFPFVDFLSSSLLFSGSSHLCFSSVHIVESLTSKLPLVIYLRLNTSLILPHNSPYLWFWWVWGGFWGNVTQCHEPTLDPFLGYELYMFERSLKSKFGLWHWFLSHYCSICVGESWENTLTRFYTPFSLDPQLHGGNNDFCLA